MCIESYYQQTENHARKIENVIKAVSIHPEKARKIILAVNYHEALLKMANLFKDVLEEYGGTIQGGQGLYQQVNEVILSIEKNII